MRQSTYTDLARILDVKGRIRGSRNSILILVFKGENFKHIYIVGINRLQKRGKGRRYWNDASKNI